MTDYNTFLHHIYYDQLEIRIHLLKMNAHYPMLFIYSLQGLISASQYGVGYLKEWRRKLILSSSSSFSSLSLLLKTSRVSSLLMHLYVNRNVQYLASAVTVEPQHINC